MATHDTSATLRELQAALASGDIDRLRSAVLQLSDEERDALALELGGETVERLTRAARRTRRARKRGRVIVVHGIMGSTLDSTDPSGDTDRIWLNLFRLLRGRIADLALDASGGPADPRLRVHVAGLMQKVYAPLVLELDHQWDVLPFGFDWREDIDHSAERLASAIEGFAAREPAHIVAHSMGGLVSRRMMQLRPDLWDSMQDPKGEAGGRLVMLGTPNRGSYAIPLALSGQEKLVKWLALLDLSHDMRQLLSILNTFPGSYQMLPSPAIDLGDDHKQLFGAACWGDLPVRLPLLQRAEAFLTGLESAVDPARFLYVAGYDQKTPFLIKVEGNAEFKLQHTHEGDGRVPHALGLLDDVPTYWIDEVHGDLPKNGRVLDALDDLLATGETQALPQTKPERRGAEAPEPGKWIPAQDVDPLPSEAEEILSRARSAGARGKPRFKPGEEALLEALVFGDYLGGTDVLRSHRAAQERTKRTRGRKGPAPKIEIEVCWGDITSVDADVYAVGHYQGVQPQNAEKRLDEAVSGLLDGAGQAGGTGHLVITEHTRRGTLRGALGDLHYFPWGDSKHRERIVAVAGMGRPGSFGVTALRRLMRNLALSLGSLPNVETVCSVLIGSGAGTLSVADAVRGVVQGLAEAVGTGEMTTRLKGVRIVELYRDRAHEILAALQEEAADGPVTRAIDLHVKEKLEIVHGGEVGPRDGLALLLAAAARAASRNQHRAALEEILDQIPNRNGVRQKALSIAQSEGRKIDRQLELAATGYRVEEIPKVDSREIPIRISVFEDRDLLKAAAITRSTTVAERILPASLGLVDDLVTKINDPDVELEPQTPSTMAHLLFPRDFRSLLRGDGPVVFEVDRVAAQIHWEILSRDVESDPVGPPVSTEFQVARQLRTEYSPRPEERRLREGPLRVLVIGDPGDPKAGANLPGARREALEVWRILRDAKGVEVTALIGAHGGDRSGLPSEVGPATLIDALEHLIHGQFDVLHYCGHGDFDERDSTRVGWLFAAGMLTAREVQALDQVPSLIVANACLSARTSRVVAGGRDFLRARTDAGLLPSLADEFFHLGVRNYVGTSWEVNDDGAVCFARHLYRELMKPERATIGEAVLAARKELYDKQRAFGKLWAAYQHYGDPTTRLRS